MRLVSSVYHQTLENELDRSSTRSIIWMMNEPPQSLVRRRADRNKTSLGCKKQAMQQDKASTKMLSMITVANDEFFYTFEKKPIREVDLYKNDVICRINLNSIMLYNSDPSSSVFQMGVENIWACNKGFRKCTTFNTVNLSNIKFNSINQKKIPSINVI